MKKQLQDKAVETLQKASREAFRRRNITFALDETHYYILDDLIEDAFNKGVEEGSLEIKDAVDEVYFSANPANSTLTEMDKVEIKSNNNAILRVQEIIDAKLKDNK